MDMTGSTLFLTVALGLGLPFLFAALSHATIRHYLLASVVSGVASGILFLAYYSWRNQWGPLEQLAFFGCGAVLGFIFAAGVGIPFHRRRTGHGLGN